MRMMIPLASLMLGALASPGLAQSADPYGQGRDHGQGEGERRDFQNEHREEHRDERRDERRDDRRDDRQDYRQDRWQGGQIMIRQDGRDWQRGRHYGWNRPDPRYNGYYADNYYRGGNAYRPRVLGYNDRIYRGRDNRYYCRRDDGTTGLIIGGISGGVLGNVIAPGGSKTLGTVIGGGLGAILGSSIARNNVVCR